MRIFLCFFFIEVFLLSVQSQDTLISVDTNKLTLLFAGDIMGHDEQIDGAWDPATESYNYEPTFRYIQDYISSADIAIGNLEVTLAGPPYKGYPQFSSPDAIAIAAKNAGFDILANANNHALDGRSKGFMRTINVIDTLGFLHMGTYRDSLDRANHFPLIVEKNNIRLALLNYTYGTNGLEIPPPFIINRIDTLQIRNDLEKAKKASPDFILVFVHWGNEYERDENSTQRKLAFFIFSHGANAIIGSHPHVVQPIKYLKLPVDTVMEYPVVYSLGNFVSNQRAQYKDGGVIAELHLSKYSDKTKLDSLKYLPYWVWRQDHDDATSTFYVLPVSRWECDSASFTLDSDDIFRLKRFASDTRQHLSGTKESGFYTTGEH
jgi:poly-gamma-glutamate capsule biosynthesis protein CapA/YwtB (metallophosphatase superfamily)